MKLADLLLRGESAEIEKVLQERFADNLSFFKNYNIKLYERLLLPPQRYNLLITQEGINLLNLEDQSLVYPCQNGKHLMLDTHLDLASSPLNHPKWKIYHNHLYLRRLDCEVFPTTAKACNAMIDILDEMGGVAEFHLPTSFLPSTTIFGALGGLFLQFLLEQGVAFHSFLLFEEEIDFFRISCYFVDYALLFERCSEASCYLFVQDLVSKEIVRHYFETHKVSNNFLRLELSLYQSPKNQSAKHIVNEAYAQNSRGWGSFEDEMIGVKNTIQNLKSSYPILSHLRRIDIPICVVGNGSSLDSLLGFIKDNQEKMVIFSCGTALKVLRNHGITPDFQIEIERIAYLKDVLEQAPLADVPLLCGNMVNPEALALAKEAYIFMRGGSAGAYYHKPKCVLELSSPFVGNAGMALACAMGSDVILCGLDCGYIEGQSKHASGSFYGKEKVEIPKDAFEVRGNQDKKVFSTSLFALSSKMMSLAISFFKPNCVLNLGSGAFISGSQSVGEGEFDLKQKDKQKAIAEIKRCFSATQEAFEGANQNPSQALNAMIDKIQNILSLPLSSKQELFKRIDEVNLLCFQKSASDPFVGVLLEGSIYHLLQNLMMCALHYPHSEIDTLYKRCLHPIFMALEEFKMKFRLALI